MLQLMNIIEFQGGSGYYELVSSGLAPKCSQALNWTQIGRAGKNAT